MDTDSIYITLDDLVNQIKKFENYYKVNPKAKIVHPFFGELNYDYWKKFQVKHFTHHFKQFNLL